MKYRLKVMVVEARQVSSAEKIYRNGRERVTANPGDWVIVRPGIGCTVLTNNDFVRMYEPVPEPVVAPVEEPVVDEMKENLSFQKDVPNERKTVKRGRPKAVK